MQTAYLKGTLLLSLSAFFIACQPVDGQSLLTNESLDDETHQVDRTPKSEELYLSLHSTNVVATGKTKVDLSGDCFISTYVKHQIIVKRDSTPINIIDYNPATSVNSQSATCKNGRFNFALYTGNLAAGQSHSLRVFLQAFEEDNLNNPIVNEGQGTSNFTVTR